MPLHELRLRFALQHGKLVLAAMPFFAATLLPELLGIFRQRFPQISIEVHDVLAGYKETAIYLLLSPAAWQQGDASSDGLGKVIFLISLLRAWVNIALRFKFGIIIARC